MIVSVITVKEMVGDEVANTRIVIGCQDMAESLAARFKALDFTFDVRHGEEKPSRNSREQLRAEDLVKKVMSH